jgi:hypothetical protein
MTLAAVYSPATRHAAQKTYVGVLRRCAPRAAGVRATVCERQCASDSVRATMCARYCARHERCARGGEATKYSRSPSLNWDRAARRGSADAPTVRSATGFTPSPATGCAERRRGEENASQTSTAGSSALRRSFWNRPTLKRRPRTGAVWSSRGLGRLPAEWPTAARRGRGAISGPSRTEGRADSDLVRRNGGGISSNGQPLRPPGPLRYPCAPFESENICAPREGGGTGRRTSLRC